MDFLRLLERLFHIDTSKDDFQGLCFEFPQELPVFSCYWHNRSSIECVSWDVFGLELWKTERQRKRSLLRQPSSAVFCRTQLLQATRKLYSSRNVITRKRSKIFISSAVKCLKTFFKELNIHYKNNFFFLSPQHSH